MNLKSRILILLPVLLIGIPPVAFAQMYQCKRDDGSMMFQDVECPAGSASKKLAVSLDSPKVMSLAADEHGHFHARLSINGVAVDGLIDTGASFITVSVATANSMKIAPEGSRLGVIQTANGRIPMFVKVVPTLRIGDIDMHDIEVSITQDSPTLIGMSALKRFKISQENGQMVMSRLW